ncbi:MAG: caspase family protein [Dehalococcoidia bacterium]
MKRLMVAILGAVLLVALVTPAAMAKPDMNKPLPATDVELVKKVTSHGKPGGGGGKPVKQAATGILGENISGNKYAIIIGISDYPGEENDLEYCDDDAEDMYDALTELYEYNSSNIHLLLNMTATFNAILNAMNALKSQAKAGDEVVFFFSGHGTRGVANDGDSERMDEAVVAHDGSNLVAIWDGQLKDWFADFPTSRIIFIFDSCLAGGMTDLKKAGRVINMACSESGVAYEDASWENGQFTYYFVDQGMLGSAADKYDNIPEVADVTVEEAFDYAKVNCLSQKPTISDSFTNDLLL